MDALESSKMDRVSSKHGETESDASSHVSPGWVKSKTGM